MGRHLSARIGADRQQWLGAEGLAQGRSGLERKGNAGMAKKSRKIRKTIRINGKPLSKTFTSREAAEVWYNHQFNRKQLEESGVAVVSRDGVLFKEFALNEFLPARKKEYPKSTWAADEQRLEAYLIPVLGPFPMNKITANQVRILLANLVNVLELSPKTRDRVRALISAIFNEALNREDGPLVSNNPTFGLSFKKGKRMGAKKPSFLHTNSDGVKYFKAAAKLSSDHVVIGGLGLNGGLRKQEMIALRWSCLDFESGTIELTEKFEQASGKILKGTKGGEQSTRHVPMSDELAAILHTHFAQSALQGPDDFILANPDGSHLGPKQLYNLHMETCAKAKVKVTVHGLRHTFGREFMERSNNMNALKEILGHTNITVTQIYSTLGKERLKTFKEVVSYTPLKGQEETNEDV